MLNMIAQVLQRSKKLLRAIDSGSNQCLIRTAVSKEGPLNRREQIFT